jgi:hypothetical protein
MSADKFPRGFVRGGSEHNRFPSSRRAYPVCFVPVCVGGREYAGHRRCEKWMKSQHFLPVSRALSSMRSSGAVLLLRCCVPKTPLAIRSRSLSSGGIVHADHGVQFTSWVFTQKIRDAGLLPSFGTVGDGLDNAMMESFWSSMQIELLDR